MTSREAVVLAGAAAFATCIGADACPADGSRPRSRRKHCSTSLATGSAAFCGSHSSLAADACFSRLPCVMNRLAAGHE